MAAKRKWERNVSVFTLIGALIAGAGALVSSVNGLTLSQMLAAGGAGAAAMTAGFVLMGLGLGVYTFGKLMDVIEHPKSREKLSVRTRVGLAIGALSVGAAVSGVVITAGASLFAAGLAAVATPLLITTTAFLMAFALSEAFTAVKALYDAYNTDTKRFDLSGTQKSALAIRVLSGLGLLVVAGMLAANPVGATALLIAAVTLTSVMMVTRGVKMPAAGEPVKTADSAEPDNSLPSDGGRTLSGEEALDDAARLARGNNNIGFDPAAHDGAYGDAKIIGAEAERVDSPTMSTVGRAGTGEDDVPAQGPVVEGDSYAVGGQPAGYVDGSNVTVAGGGFPVTPAEETLVDENQGEQGFSVASDEEGAPSLGK